jgi:hypothetical protein
VNISLPKYDTGLKMRMNVRRISYAVFIGEQYSVVLGFAQQSAIFMGVSRLL